MRCMPDRCDSTGVRDRVYVILYQTPPGINSGAGVNGAVNDLPRRDHGQDLLARLSLGRAKKLQRCAVDALITGYYWKIHRVTRKTENGKPTTLPMYCVKLTLRSVLHSRIS